MFFKDMATWDNKKLRCQAIIWKVLYYILTLVCPAIIIINNYQIFKEVEPGIKLTGIGIILSLAFAVFALSKIKKEIKKLPNDTHKELMSKNLLELAFSLFIPLFIMFILSGFKTNFDLAYKTIKNSVFFIMGGIIIDKLAVEFINREYELRHENTHNKEVLKRG